MIWMWMLRPLPLSTSPCARGKPTLNSCWRRSRCLVIFIDTSEIEVLLYPSEFKIALKLWLQLYPEKITFGSDTYPYNAALGSEESYWQGVESAHTALAAALAEMVAAGEITERKALEIARGYLHDNAIRLYPPATQQNGSNAGHGRPGA